MKKRIVTVLGKISPEELGITLPHEHLLVDASCYLRPAPKNSYFHNMVDRPVSLDNRGEVVYKSSYFKDNLLITDIDAVINEAKKFKETGGSTIVDLTVSEIGRNAEALYKISIDTGLNIIMGSGHYTEKSNPDDYKNRSLEELTRDIINDFTVGVSDKGIKAGIIGEVGISDINNKIEIKNLHASALAQKKLNCAMNIHCPELKKDNNKILDILEKLDVDLNKVVLSHCDPTLDDIDYHDSLAKRGAYIEYDQFGMEIMSVYEKFLPSDGDRIKGILNQIERGNINRLLISQDICLKILHTKWGGFGYSHIQNHIIPRMKEAGITDEQIYKITIENPRELLAF